MAEAVTITASSDTPQELKALIDKAYVPKPDTKNLAALRRYVDAHPGDLARVLNLAKIIQGNLIQKVTGAQPVVELATEDSLGDLRRGLGYDQAPELERLIIQNIENCQLRLQWVEYQVAQLMGKGEVRFADIEMWEKRLSTTQARLLRACESLARVRRMTSPVQVNIAQEGGQQVNVAGDLVR